MRTIRIRPMSEGYAESSRYRALLSAVANVLAWASEGGYSTVTYIASRESPFEFIDRNGVVSRSCENVAQPPKRLRIKLDKSILRAIAYHDFLLYFVNRLLIRFWGYKRTAMVRLIVDNSEHSSWELTYTKGAAEFVLLQR